MIFVFSAVILTLGISVAYYNTCSLAFDGEPVIASANDEKITFLDFSVSRKELKKIKNEIAKECAKDFSKEFNNTDEKIKNKIK